MRNSGCGRNAFEWHCDPMTFKYLWTLPVAMLSVLVGCSAAEGVSPAPSTPAAVATSPAPMSTAPTLAASSDAERLAAVVPTYEAMWVAVDQLQDAGGVGAPTQAMKETMTAANLEYWSGRAAQWRTEGRRYTGKNRVVDANVEASALSPTAGSAQVKVCVDMSDVQAFSKSGAPLKRTTKPFLSGTVALVWSDGRWLVDGFIDGPGTYADQCV